MLFCFLGIIFLRPAGIPGIFWSLSVEEHFYLLWPVILFVLPIKRRLMLTLGVLALSIMFRELEYGQNLHTLAIREIKISYRTDYVLSFLLWGCALATLFEEAKFINMAKKLFFPGSIAVVLGLQIVATLSEHRLALWPKESYFVD